ncbi:hypothetical protein SLEP1_g36295 [Rubroshorea leprosula]|uniref:Uncharacterized protein n=1 Tax=Rubroshorea leprosula TaxID=152421 RepID=A0AAV5KRL5_9ROSI|nr:hypothetical protein SLEP1_g36295 [Rubroshorea leprosula]
MEGLQIVNVHKGLIRCNFIVTRLASDSGGNWHVGAMTNLIDCVGNAAIHTTTVGHINVTLDCTISTAKIQVGIVFFKLVNIFLDTHTVW